MGDIATEANSIYREFEDDGVPESGDHKPIKSEIRSLFTLINAALADIGLLGAVTVAYATKAELDADLAHAAGTLGLVYADAVGENNLVYIKLGASGAGSWDPTDFVSAAAVMAALVSAKDAALGEITDTKDAALVDIGSSKDGALGEITTAKDDAITEIGAVFYPESQHTTVEQVFDERFALLDLTAQTYTNLTDATAPSVTKTKVAGGLQLNLTTASRTYAFSTENRLNPVSRTRLTYTAQLTFASACICGFGIYDGTDRMTVQVNQAGWITYTNTRGGGATITTNMGAIASGSTVKIEAVTDQDAGTTAFFVSVNGAAPYTFGITANVFPGNIELIQRGSSTVIHAIDLEGIGPLERDALNAFVPSPLTDPNRNAIAAAAGLIEILKRNPPADFTASIPNDWGFYAASFVDPIQFFTGIDLQPILVEEDPTVAVYYVDLATGSDTAAGTEAAPLKSLKVAGARILAGGRALIKAKGGLYPYANAFGGAVGGSKWQAVSWDGERVISSRHDNTLSWTLTTGTTYQATYTNGIAAVFDAAHLTDDGDYTRVILAADLATCEATPGTYFLSGGVIYLNLSDARAPDGDVRVYKKSSSGTADNYNLRLVAAGQTLYLEDVYLEGGVEPFTVYSAGDAYSATVYAKGCAFKYGAGANNINWASPGLCVLQDCLGAWSSQDGFNYKPSGFGSAKPLCIEIRCESRKNGYDGAGTNNASTGHGVDLIRFKGLYFGSENRNVHDIASGSVGAISWNIDCTSRDSRSSNNVNFAAGVTGEAAGTIMYLDNCTSSGSTTDLQANGGAIIRHSGLISGGVFSGDGTIETYTP